MAKPRMTFKAAKQKAAKVQAKPRNSVVYLKAKDHKVTAVKGSKAELGPKVGGVQFPLGDKDYRIDVSFQEPYVFKVFYWAERPDKIHRAPDDQFHWHPDSEHTTVEAAQKRMASLKGGAKKTSIMGK